MDDTAIGEHLVKSLLAFPWSPRFRFHFDKEHLVIAQAEAEQVEETVWQAVDNVLAVKA